MPPGRPPTVPVICAIARTVITEDPRMEDAEWKARVKERLIQQGWDYPRPGLLADCLDRVERALTREWGPRPTPLPVNPPLPLDPPDQGDPWKDLPRSGQNGWSGVIASVDAVAPNAADVLRRALHSPEVQGAIHRAKVRDREIRAARMTAPGRTDLSRLALAIQEYRDAKKAVSNADSNIPGPGRSPAEGE